MARGQVRPGSANALVTGAGRGLGRQYAEQLAALGYNLVLVGRSSSVETAAREIGVAYPGIKAEAIIQDLSERGAAEALFNEVSAKGLHIDVLILNAGTFSFKDITETTPEKIEEIITLHDITLTKLNRLFAKDMIERGGGHILNMSSFSIWMPFPGISLYSASKAYVRNFSVSFSKEVREKKVYVTTICPAGIATDLYGLSKNLQRTGIRFGVLMTPANCARRALRALWRHRRLAIPDWWNWFTIPVCMHLPDWAENIIRRKTMRFQK